jgi:hypothetical protein
VVTVRKRKEERVKPTSPVLDGMPEVLFAKDQQEYMPLPAVLCADSHRTVITKWRLSFVERIKILFRGSLFHHQFSFDKPLQPIYISIEKPNLSLVPVHDEDGNIYCGGKWVLRKECMFVDNTKGRAQ